MALLCKALMAVDRFTTVVVVADDTVLSYHDVSLFLFPIRTRLPIGSSHALASSLDIYVVLGLGACIETFWVNEPDDADQLIQPDTPSQSSETRELHLDLPSAQL